MCRIIQPKADLRWIRTLGAMLFLLGMLLYGCGGGGADVPQAAAPGSGLTQNNAGADGTWKKKALVQLTASGMLIPNLEVVFDGEATAHLAYFTDSTDTAGAFTLNHTTIGLTDLSAGAATPIVDIDNSRTLGFDLDPAGNPVTAYQGGEVRECGSEQQSDVMVSAFQQGSWTETTAGIGYVERNPVFTDGLAGRTVTAAVDSAGDVHVAYQFFYEGCDAMNFNYPDLLYVRKSSGNLQADVDEETVEGNRYNANGTASVQNTVGAYACLILDADEDPAIFYYANLVPTNTDPDQKGLRLARRKNGVWSHEWVETGFEIGAVSAHLAPDGKLAAAYYVISEYQDSLGTHTRLLKYATQADTGWDTGIVDESVKCGSYVNLAFTQEGRPAAAYYAEENHSGSTSLQDLKYAQFNGSTWETETVSAAGDIGWFNNLWFDSAGVAYICSYSASQDTIYLFYR